MTERPQEKQEHPFIQEQIVSKRKKRVLKRLATFGFVVFMAVIFGLVACAVFLAAEEPLREWLGRTDSSRQPVDLPKPTTLTLTPTPTIRITMTPAPTRVLPEPTRASITPKPTKQPEPTATVTPEPEEPVVTPGGEGMEPTPLPTVQPTAAATEPTKQPEPTATITPGAGESEQAYLLMYQAIRKQAEAAEKGLVALDAVVENRDWFQEVYQTRTRTSGLVVGNDGIDLLILTDYAVISGANAIEVTFFDDRIVNGTLFSYDADFGIAIVAVPLTQIAEETLSGVRTAILAEEESISIGNPILALGAPNGYRGSMELGMVTSLGAAVPVVDGQLRYFTTNLTNYTQGHGFVFSLRGEVLGMISHSVAADSETALSTAISLDAIRAVIVRLLNNMDYTYFGIKGTDLPRELQEASGAAAGIYVSEVLAASPAMTAGVRSGDILIAADGKALTRLQDLTELVLSSTTKNNVAITLLRMQGTEIRQTSVTVQLQKKVKTER